jgi:hypothetical protein
MMEGAGLNPQAIPLVAELAVAAGQGEGEQR